MEPRTDDDIAEQYRVEVDLSNRLKRAPAAERARLYTEVYEELFRRVPNHPQLARKFAGSTENVSWQLGLLSRYLDRDTCLLEIGAGDLSFSVAVAPRTKKVVAVDVSPIISERDDLPPNVERRICDGMSLPVEAGTVDVAYSNQLIEHLHPDDAQEHVDNVFKALRPNGIYVCVTPNRLGGHGTFRATSFGLRPDFTSENTRAQNWSPYSTLPALRSSDSMSEHPDDTLRCRWRSWMCWNRFCPVSPTPSRGRCAEVRCVVSWGSSWPRESRPECGGQERGGVSHLPALHSAVAVGRARVAPGDCVVPRDPGPALPQRAIDREKSRRGAICCTSAAPSSSGSMPLTRIVLPRRASAAIWPSQWPRLSWPRCENITLKLRSCDRPSQSCIDFS